jgi:hypothetical protein
MILGEMTADALAHVLWLGGAPRCGKTTLARLLAGKYDLKIYDLDWHYWREHQRRLDPVRHPVSVAWKERTMDELWVEPSGYEIVERAVALWDETFDLVVDDLLALPRTRPLLAQGPGAFPSRVARLLSSPSQALFLVPTAQFRDAVLERRLAARGRRFGEDTRDPERARQNHRTHDLGLASRVAASCAKLRLRCVVLDGSLGLDDSLALVEEHFRPCLPTTLNV